MLTSSFPRFKGDAAGIFVYRLSSALSKKGLDIRVVSPHDNGYRKSEIWDGIRIQRFPYFLPHGHQSLCYGAGILKNMNKKSTALFQLPSFLLMQAITSFMVLRNCKVDAIHAHWSLPQGLVGVLCGKILGLRCVTTIHGSDIYAFKNPLLRLLNSLVINKSDVCTANSAATARKAGEISGRKDIEIIPMGFDPKVFGRLGNRDVPSPKHEKTILYVGRLIDWKGIDYLVKAFKMVKGRFPGARLIIVGDGPQKARLVALAASLGLTDSVAFLGNLPQEELPGLYAKASVFVLPSIVNTRGETEGLGLVLLEAMACGTPVVGSAVGGIPDIIKNRETGLLARPGDSRDLADKINTLLSNESLARDLSARALRYVRENFSWDMIAERFKGIYQRVTHKNTHGQCP